MGWIVLDWIVSILLLIAFAAWAVWFAMRVIRAYSLAEGSGWVRLRAALIAVLSASWATVTAPFKALWAAGFKSLTILWGYLGIAGSYAAANLDSVGEVLGDPDLKQQIVDALKDNPKLLGYALGTIFAITLLSRLRSLVFKPKPAE
jgi:hypothetical protein